MMSAHRKSLMVGRENGTKVKYSDSTADSPPPAIQPETTPVGQGKKGRQWAVAETGQEEAMQLHSSASCQVWYLFCLPCSRI